MHARRFPAILKLLDTFWTPKNTSTMATLARNCTARLPGSVRSGLSTAYSCDAVLLHTCIRLGHCPPRPCATFCGPDYPFWHWRRCALDLGPQNGTQGRRLSVMINALMTQVLELRDNARTLEAGELLRWLDDGVGSPLLTLGRSF